MHHCAEVTTYERFPSYTSRIDLTFSFICLRYYLTVLRAFARATTVKEDLSVFCSSPCLFLCIIIRCLCSYFRYLLLFLIHMCARIHLYECMRFCIFVMYIYTEMFTLFFYYFLTYYVYLSKERTQLASAI